MIIRSIRRPVRGVIDCPGATSSSRFRPSGVSSKTQLKITAGTNPIVSQNDDDARKPLRCPEHWQHCPGYLHHQPCTDEIESRHADDVAPFQLAEEIGGIHRMNALSLVRPNQFLGG